MKKLIAIILSLSIFGSIGFAFDAQSLSLLGVKISSDETELALRKDFVTNVVDFIGLPHLSSSVQIFSDVPEEHANFGAIMAAYDSQLIYGNHNLQFMPDTPATYEDAIMIFIRLLGYDVYLNQGMDYRTVAINIGLTDGISYNPKDWLTHSDMQKLFSNVADIPTFEIEYNGMNYNYNENGDTLLEKYRNATILNGIVQGVGENVIELNARTREDYITINGQEYYTNGIDLSEYLGMYVEYVYVVENGTYTICAVSPIGKCTYVDINLRDIDDFNNMTIKYTDEQGKEKKVKLDTNVIISYNGTPISTFSPALFAGDNGSMRLIDNSGDSSVDVVLIEEYEDIFIGNIDTVNKIIYDKYRQTSGGSPVFVDLSSLDEEDIINSKGKPVEVKQLQRGMLISVLKTDTGVPVKAIVCSGIQDGIVTAFDSNRNIATVKQNQYYITQTCLDNYALCVGDNVEFYINVCGNVAAITTFGAGNVQFGYLMKLPYNPDDEVMSAWILTQDNVKIKCTINQKFTLNGVKNTHSYSTLLSEFSDTYGFLPQVVRFTLDSKGNVAMLDSVGSANEGSAPSLVSIYDKTSSMRYTTNGSSFSSKLIVDGAVIFQVPDESDPTKRGTYDDKKYKVISQANLINNRNYTVAAYSTDPQEFVADAFVVYDTSSSGTGMYDGENLSIVKSIGMTLNPEGDVVPLIEYCYNGEVYEFPVESNTVIDDALEDARVSNPGLELQVGDAIRIARNENNEINYIHYVYSIADGRNDTLAALSGTHAGSPIANSELNKYDYFVISLGHIYKFVNGNVYLAKKSVINTGAELGLDNLAAFKADTVPVVIYDPNEKETVRVANINELSESSGGVEGDFVLVKTYLGALNFIYVIRN